MTKLRLLGVVALLGILAAVAAVAFFLGDGHALGTLSVRHVSPDQAATAMQSDGFYSDYREATLIIRGLVVSVQQSTSGVVLQFATHTNFKTVCQLAQYPSEIARGDTITIVTEAYNAKRLPSEVSLSDCIIVSRG